MKISVYRQKLRDVFYERLERERVCERNTVKRVFEESGEQVLLDMLEEVENDIEHYKRNQ